MHLSAVHENGDAEHSSPAYIGARVLIIDDHRLFAEALGWALARRGMLVDLARDADAALAIAGRQRPNLVLLDLELDGANGLLVGKRITQHYPDCRILVLAPRVILRRRELLQRRFSGYVTRDTSIERLIDAINVALKGQFVTVPSSLPGSGRAVAANGQQLLTQQLTPREREVLGLLADGMGSREIAERLSIGQTTVRSHVQSILTKLQVHSRLQAAAFATKHRILASRG